MISFNKSIEVLKSTAIKPKETVNLPLMEAQGYILAQDIIAQFNSPSLPTAGMDGYAIRFEDQKNIKLKIEAINPAGNDEILTLSEGKAIKTFTGSLMPKNSDTLIPIENVEEDEGYIVIKEPVEFGFSVREIGENFKKGEVLIKKGTKIDFAQIGVLASLNIEEVKVYKKPIVGVIATGNELLSLGQKQTKKSQIRSSNNYTIEAIVKKYGAIAKNYGCFGDDKETITKIFKKALNECDIVVSTGGVSVGDYDFVKDVVKDELKAEVLFKGVVIKPGQHIMFAKVDNKSILALPGFAYSSTVTALIYLLPLIYKYQNFEYEPLILKATLESNFIKKSKKTEFSACNLKAVDKEIKIDFRGKKDGTSAIMTNMLGNCALAMTNEDETNKEVGEKIDTFIYDLNFEII